MGSKTYLRHRVEESTSDTLFMRKGKFGDEECPSGENEVGAHNRSNRSDKSVSPVRRRRNDNGEKEARSGCCPSAHNYTGNVKSGNRTPVVDGKKNAPRSHTIGM